MKRSRFLQALGFIAVAPVAIAKAVESSVVINPITEIYPKLRRIGHTFPGLRQSPQEIIDLYHERGVILVDASSDSFESGFADGFCEGYKNVKGQYATCPVAPVAPVPEVGQDTYKGGYNAGFLKGREKASE